MHSPSFSVAGLSSSTNAHHGHSTSAWGSTSNVGPLTTTLGDSLSQSRTQYQPGYLLSSQGNAIVQGSQRADEAPLVQTKAKINHVLLRGSASDFGMDSMFEGSRQRQRQAFTDEDAPPMSSVNDIPNELHVETHSTRFLPRSSTLDSLQKRHSRSSPSISQPSQTLFVIVFGYPPDKYTLTVEYFKSLGSTTEPDLNTEIVNCFKIGYLDAGDAMRAVRKNGEVLGGSWMVGAKWADAAQAEALLGQTVVRGSLFGTSPPLERNNSQTSLNAMAVDDSPASQRSRGSTSTPTVGTPIKLAPSTSAFRKPGKPEKAPPPIQQQQIVPGMSGSLGSQVSGNKGVMGQVSDLIFGW